MSTPKERPAALPARMSLVTEAFEKFSVAVLPFPFLRAVMDFKQGIEKVVYKGNRVERPTWRQLNNFLLACAPTLTHGFEWSQDDVTKQSTYRALAVGTPDMPLRLPELARIHLMIKIWAHLWAERFQGKGIDDLCRCFLDAIDEMPADWKWQTVAPQTLAQDVYAENGLGFQAVPALLATLLHGKTSVIHGGHGPQKIRWRKVQGNGSGPTGLYVVSQPFRASYTDDHGNFKEGYFAYRLDFRPQTQAGRFHTNDTDKKPVMKPWLFLDVSCQRYAHEPLVKPNFKRDLSLLAGMRADASLLGCPDDGTLVRLTAGYEKGSIVWRHQLPRLLAELRAKELPAPQSIFDDPAAFGNLNNSEDWKRPKYLLVTATGYQFGSDTKHAHQHSIKTGYSLRERGNVIARVLDLLEDVLVPDGPLEQDIDTPAGIKAPLILRDFKWLSARQQKYQPTVVKAVERAMGGATMHLFVLWREAHTREQMQAQLRNAFLLEEGDPFPPNVHVQEIFINDAALLSPLPAAAITPDSDRPATTIKASEEDEEDSDDNEDDGDNGDNEANENDEDNLNPTSDQRAERSQKLKAWHDFLSAHVPASSSTRLAFIEISPRTKATAKNVAALNLHGIIREACARESIGSQMVQTVLPRDFAPDKKDATKPHILKSATKGRVLNAALDITHRHIGALYGPPAEIYQAARIPEAVAQEMDIIALCRRQTNRKDTHYALAVRLCASGVVEAMLPDRDEWIPYTQAAVAVGRIYTHARMDVFKRGKRMGQIGRDRSYHNPIKLNGAQLAHFAERVLTQPHTRPTLALIEADVWRNGRGEYAIWPQLRNDNLCRLRDVLHFGDLASSTNCYGRSDPALSNLLGVVRLRKGQETPQYITYRSAWHEEQRARDIKRLSGFWDASVPDLPHYFSVGRLADTLKGQDEPAVQGLYMMDKHSGGDARSDRYGANTAFKHPQFVEMVPFFVREDMRTDEGKKALCRAAHFLRSSPAWTMGNLVEPYPMHLGDCLMADQLCILDIEKSD